MAVWSAIGPIVGILIGWALTQYAESKRREWHRADARAEWLRGALHKSGGEFISAVKAYEHNLSAVSDSISRGQHVDLTEVMTNSRDLSAASASIVPLLPHHVGDQVLQLEIVGYQLLREVREGRPMGVDTPTESLFREFGRRQGMLLSELRYRLTGELPDGYEPLPKPKPERWWRRGSSRTTPRRVT